VPPSRCTFLPAEVISAQGSLITSAGKNVHLDGGTQMLLVTRAATGANGSTGKSAPGKPEEAGPKAAREPNRE